MRTTVRARVAPDYASLLQRLRNQPQDLLGPSRHQGSMTIESAIDPAIALCP